MIRINRVDMWGKFLWGKLLFQAIFFVQVRIYYQCNSFFEIYLESRIYTIKISSKRINDRQMKLRNHRASQSLKNDSQQKGPNLDEFSTSYTLAKQALGNQEYDLAQKIIKNDTSNQHWHHCLKSRILYQMHQPQKAFHLLKSCINFQRHDCQQCLLLLVNLLKQKQIDISIQQKLMDKICCTLQNTNPIKKQLQYFLKDRSSTLLTKRIDFRKPCNDLVKVYQKKGAKADKVAITEVSEGYRVAVAKSLIKPRQMIIFVPENQIITLETAKKNHISKKVANQEQNLKSPKHCLLAVYLLIQKQKGQSSSYFKYINSLPKKLDNFPVFYSQQLCQQLKGTSFLSILNRKKADIKQDYMLISRLLHKEFLIKEDDFIWARMIVCSRIFGIIMYGNKTDALVPIADMLNHKIPKMTSWSFSDALKGFVVQNGLRSIPEGQQIFDSYGQKCNSRFLLNYGFIQPDNIANQVGITLKRNERRRFHQYSIRISRNLASQQFKALLQHFRRQIYCQQQQDSQQEHEQNKFYQYISKDIEIKAWNEIENICNTKLYSMQSTIEEDSEQLLEANINENLKNCVLIRLGEKQVLQFYIKMGKKMKQYLKKPKKRDKSYYKQYEIYLKTLPEDLDTVNFS